LRKIGHITVRDPITPPKIMTVMLPVPVSGGH